METIEIRQNKKTLIPMLAVLTATLFGMTYYIYFSGKSDNNNTMKIVYVFLTASVLYTIYIPTKKFLKNEPVLTFSKSEIVINEKGKPASFLWLQVIDWNIEKEEDGGTLYLTIETADTKKRINISWLDKRPNEIEQLLQTYKPR
jgi:hypothetical protein